MNKLPDAELSVMLVIWNSKEPLTANEILEGLDDKDWHIATLNKLLSRLIERNFIEVVNPSRPKKYGYIVDEKDYKMSESKDFLKKLHKNSFSSLVASLFADKNLSEEDIKELEKLVHSKKESKN